MYKRQEKYLGKEKITFEDVNEEDQVGIVRGLAWTSVGGDTLQIEVNVMPGKGTLQMTGQMGDVMKESAQTALSYIRSICPEYGVADDYFEKHDIHLHIPEGAVPKDGPSAGITMATAMLSAVTGRKVDAKRAMTGEITPVSYTHLERWDRRNGSSSIPSPAPVCRRRRKRISGTATAAICRVL